RRDLLRRMVGENRPEACDRTGGSVGDSCHSTVGVLAQRSDVGDWSISYAIHGARSVGRDSRPLERTIAILRAPYGSRPRLSIGEFVVVKKRGDPGKACGEPLCRKLFAGVGLDGAIDRQSGCARYCLRERAARRRPFRDTLDFSTYPFVPHWA